MRGAADQNGVARHFVPEPFRTYTQRELTAAPPWVAGLCFNAGCGREFVPAREWQMFCCKDCERDSVAELRIWGHRMALPLLVWRMGKYEAQDEAVRDRTRAARRYVAHAQSAWLADRQQRAGVAR
jgi:hypothetical protein